MTTSIIRIQSKQSLLKQMSSSMKQCVHKQKIFVQNCSSREACLLVHTITVTKVLYSINVGRNMQISEQNCNCTGTEQRAISCVDVLLGSGMTLQALNQLPDTTNRRLVADCRLLLCRSIIRLFIKLLPVPGDTRV